MPAFVYLLCMCEENNEMHINFLREGKKQKVCSLIFPAIYILQIEILKKYFVVFLPYVFLIANTDQDKLSVKYKTHEGMWVAQLFRSLPLAPVMVLESRE